MTLARPIDSPRRVTDVVHARLRDAVLSHELQAGEALSVPSLARRLKVSRSPVREAVLLLVADGLATNEPRKGAVVSMIEGAELLDLHDMREVLEGLAARLAAERITDEGRKLMKSALARQKEGVREKDAKIYTATDLDFHAALYEAAGVPRLRRLLEALTDQMRLSVNVSLVHPDHQRLGLKEHEAVLNALSKGDAAGAEECMRRHVRNSRARVAAQLRKLGPRASAETRPAGREKLPRRSARKAR